MITGAAALPLRFSLRIFIAVLLHVLLRHQFKRDPLVGIDFFPFDHLLRHLDRFFALTHGILEHGDGQFAACQGFQAIRRGINAAHQNGFLRFRLGNRHGCANRHFVVVGGDNIDLFPVRQPVEH